MTGAMKEIDIHTDKGMSIREQWEHGPRTSLGIMIAGFPNHFMITGPLRVIRRDLQSEMCSDRG